LTVSGNVSVGECSRLSPEVHRALHCLLLVNDLYVQLWL